MTAVIVTIGGLATFMVIAVIALAWLETRPTRTLRPDVYCSRCGQLYQPTGDPDRGFDCPRCDP